MVAVEHRRVLGPAIRANPQGAVRDAVKASQRWGGMRWWSIIAIVLMLAGAVGSPRLRLAELGVAHHTGERPRHSAQSDALAD